MTARGKRDIRVFFAHPSPIIHYTYQEMLFHPPTGVQYVNARAFGTDYAAVKASRRTLMARVLGLLSYLPLPTYARVPDTCDLVYASQCIPLTRKPWILDVEFPEGIARFHPRLFRFPLVRMLVRHALRSDRCKGITFWSDAARDGFAHVIGEDIVRAKGTVIRPAITTRPADLRARRATRPLALFVGRDFLRKGGMEAITAFERVARKHPTAEFVVVTQLPAGIDPAQYPHVRFLPKLDRSALLTEYFPRASVYLMPSFHDTIVLVWLEAMRFGVPIIGLKDYASQEVLGGCGVLIDSYKEEWFTAHKLTNTRYPTIERLIAAHAPEEFERVVRDITRALDRLFSDDALRRRLGAAGRRKVTAGEFGMRHKNARLRALFRTAVSR